MSRVLRRNVPSALLIAVLLIIVGPTACAANGDAPGPLLAQDEPVDWWFMFKLGAVAFPGCGADEARICAFGGSVQTYKSGFGQQFIYASKDNPALKQGGGCAGDTIRDPLGATFSQVYQHKLNFAIWNDQFYGHPKLPCANSKGNCDKPWGHSKGILAWNDDGAGFVLQVSTPSWPGAGSQEEPRKNDGNTLGCVLDNNVLVAQHFFALKLTRDDLVKVLRALANASVATDPSNSQIVRNGGPPDVQDLVASLGKRSSSGRYMKEMLSSGVGLISKPSNLNVPPWQLVSAVLGRVALRTATWWAYPWIPTTTATTRISCWSDDLERPNRVQIATTGQWNGKEIGLTGTPTGNGNHAKIGVSMSGDHYYAIFGDLNQQGALSGDCASSQNGRGGLFFVVENRELAEAITDLIDGDTASTKTPQKPLPKKPVPTNPTN